MKHFDSLRRPSRHFGRISSKTSAALRRRPRLHRNIAVAIETLRPYIVEGWDVHLHPLGSSLVQAMPSKPFGRRRDTTAVNRRRTTAALRRRPGFIETLRRRRFGGSSTSWGILEVGTLLGPATRRQQGALHQSVDRDLRKRSISTSTSVHPYCRAYMTRWALRESDKQPA